MTWSGGKLTLRGCLGQRFSWGYQDIFLGEMCSDFKKNTCILALELLSEMGVARLPLVQSGLGHDEQTTHSTIFDKVSYTIAGNSKGRKLLDEWNKFKCLE